MSGVIRHPRPRYADGSLGLALAIVEGSANLRGARCTEFPADFDPDRRAEDLGFATEGQRWQHCQVVCRACPARGECWAWATELPAQARPRGPLADTAASPFRPGRVARDRAEDGLDDGDDEDGPDDLDPASDTAVAS